jgi:hypothetical protein
VRLPHPGLGTEAQNAQRIFDSINPKQVPAFREAFYDRRPFYGQFRTVFMSAGQKERSRPALCDFRRGKDKPLAKVGLKTNTINPFFGPKPGK